jgi:ABC-type glycerol-3-phosphate transport system substrate-binding protein
MTKSRILIALAAGTLVLAACGSDGGGGGSADGPQGDAAAKTIEQAADDGVELDEDCVNEVASQLSDEDAEAIASGNDGDVSEAGSALSIDLIACADEDALADLFIEGMGASGDEFDEACVREKLADFDMTEVVEATQSGTPPADLVAAMMECINTDG